MERFEKNMERLERFGTVGLMPLFCGVLYLEKTSANRYQTTIMAFIVSTTIIIMHISTTIAMSIIMQL